jgi:hypothetical protein
MASQQLQAQRRAVFSANGDYFSDGGTVQLPRGTYYLVVASTWFGKLAVLHGCEMSETGQIQVTQGMALAIFLRLEPTLSEGVMRLSFLRHVLSDIKLDSFIAALEPLVIEELDRRGEVEWVDLSSAYETLDSLQHGMTCVPADFLLTEQVTTANTALRVLEAKYKNWTFGAMVNAASYKVAANFVQNLGNYARAADKTDSESDFSYLLKQILLKMSPEDREHRDACAGLTRVFRKSRLPDCYAFENVHSAPDFMASIVLGIELSNDATRSGAWAQNIPRFINSFRLTAILLDGAPDQRSALQRLTSAANLEGGLNQAIMDAVEGAIDEHLSQSLESYRALSPVDRIAKACQDMQAALARVKRAYSNASEGTPEQARAQAQSLTSVNRSPEYARFQHALEVAQRADGFEVFNPDGRGAGAHQFLFHSLYHSNAPSADLVVKLLRGLKSQYGSYFSATRSR